MIDNVIQMKRKPLLEKGEPIDFETMQEWVYPAGMPFYSGGLVYYLKSETVLYGGPKIKPEDRLIIDE